VIVVVGRGWRINRLLIEGERGCLVGILIEGERG
jgi:hypothetical protein